MAYLNPKVYLNGLSSELKDDVFIALTKTAITNSTLNTSNIVAISEIRKGLGTTAVNNEQTSEQFEYSGNNIANYDSKVLTINNVGYSRTLSLVGSDDSGSATNFAICKLGNNIGENKIAYTGAYFFGPKCAKNSSYEVVIAGALSQTATLNSNSNFMFSGASITFEETDINN